MYINFDKNKVIIFFLDVYPVVNDTSPVWPPVNDNKIKNQWNELSNDQWDMSNEPSWSENVVIKDELTETPESPPMYEKTSFNAPVEYNDSQSQDPILSSVRDVDHRYNNNIIITTNITIFNILTNEKIINHDRVESCL